MIAMAGLTPGNLKTRWSIKITPPQQVSLIAMIQLSSLFFERLHPRFDPHHRLPEMFHDSIEKARKANQKGRRPKTTSPI